MNFTPVDKMELKGVEVLMLSDLFECGHNYNFFQILRILNRILGVDGDGIKGLKIRSNMSLGFPGSSVERLENDENGYLALIVNIMTLYGSCSPLPTFYTEDLFAEDRNDDASVRSVIDALNQRLHYLFFKALLKSSPMIRHVESGDESLVRIFFSLMGLDKDSVEKTFKNPGVLLRYAGLFSMSVRSASGLETILEDALNVPVCVVQAVEKKITIPHDQRNGLGVNIKLGIQASLGKKTVAKGCAFKILIGPVNVKDYMRLIPGTEDHDLLNSLTDLYLTSPLMRDLEFIVSGGDIKDKSCSGRDKLSCLGFDSWIFSGKSPGLLRSFFQT